MVKIENFLINYWKNVYNSVVESKHVFFILSCITFNFAFLNLITENISIEKHWLPII